MSFLTDKISRKNLDSLIEPYQTNVRVLDVGRSGSPDYQKYFPNRVVVDVNPGPGITITASVYDLPFKDGEFDLVLCIAVLEHLEDPIKAAHEMRRVLKSGGRIIISVPFMFPIHDAPNDYWRFTKFGLRKLFSEGWIIETVVAESNTQETLAVILQRVGYQTKMKLNSFSKFTVFFLAQILGRMPNMIKAVYGDIGKKHEEPEAFANGFFLTAKKI